MTRAFIDSGKRHIAFFGSMDDPRDLSRYRGTENALAAQGLEAYHPRQNDFVSSAGAQNVSAGDGGKAGY